MMGTRAAFEPTDADAAGTAEAPRTRLPAGRIGLLGGLVGILCCVGPTVLALVGVVSAATAVAWANELYGQWAWAFRLAGLAVLAGLVVVALRRRGACSLKGAWTVRRKLALAGIVAAVTYGGLYAATAWLERVTVG
jgi:nitrate reductase gamma subunit